jgi:hypothetical protein
MLSLRRPLLVAAFVAAIAGAACGNPPDKELQEAQTAIDAAQSAGADQLAHEEFAAATDALKRARDAVTDRDYRLALNNALDARERAQTAAKEATNRKVGAKKAAERALADVSAALTAGHTALKRAQNERIPAKSLAASTAAIADAEQGVQEARTAFDAGNYPAATDAATRTITTLRRISRDLEAMIAPAPHRRRSAQRRK